MNIELIPLSKLIACPKNVRRTGRNDGIAELAASIKAHGLLQNLQVRAGTGGKFEVVAGQRRLAAAGSRIGSIFASRLGFDLAHLEIESIAPERARLPITGTGYRSHFTSPDTVAAHGGPAAFVEAWLESESQAPDWRREEQ